MEDRSVAYAATYRTIGKRAEVSPAVAPRVETFVHSAEVVNEDTVPICVLAHDIYKIQVKLVSFVSSPRSVIAEACLDTGA